MQAIQESSAIGAEVLANVVGEFREAIEVVGTALGAADTVPDLVRAHVINRTRWQWLDEFPSMKQLQTETREAGNTAAEKALEDIRNRDLVVPPGDGSPIDQSLSPSITPRCRDMDKGDQQGL